MRERHSATESTPRCPLAIPSYPFAPLRPLFASLSSGNILSRALFCFSNTTWLFQNAPSQEANRPLPFSVPSLPSYPFGRFHSLSLLSLSRSVRACPCERTRRQLPGRVTLLSREKDENLSTSLSPHTTYTVGVGRFTRWLVYLLKRGEQPSTDFRYI